MQTLPTFCACQYGGDAVLHAAFETFLLPVPAKFVGIPSSHPGEDNDANLGIACEAFKHEPKLLPAWLPRGMMLRSARKLDVRHVRQRGFDVEIAR